VRKARSGTARRRGRSTRSGTSALIIVGNDSKLIRLSQSITGVDIKHVKDLNMLDLVPGSKPIRLTIFSEHAIEYMKRLQAPVHKVLEVIGK
jgi:large subunit ribosomal protein L4e